MNSFTRKVSELFTPKDVLKKRKEEQNEIVIREWRKNGCPVPPPDVIKQLAISSYQETYGYNTLIETGTYKGDMVEAQKSKFQKIISIELGVKLFNKAKRRFKGDKNVTIVQGDSGKMLPEVVKDLKEPAIFWLDGHYSDGITAKGDKECPILEELDSIFKAKNLNHIILVDDARLFVGVGDYPTIEELTTRIKTKNPRYEVEVKDDIIRYVAK